MTRQSARLMSSLLLADPNTSRLSSDEVLPYLGAVCRSSYSAIREEHAARNTLTRFTISLRLLLPSSAQRRVQKSVSPCGHRLVPEESVQAYPYIAKNRYCMGEYFDMTIVDELAGYWYALSEDQNRPELTWCKGKIKPGQTAVDCGAHHGLMSILFSRWVGPSGRVIAYEAVSTNAATAAANLELNHCTNVVVRPVAVSDRRRTLAFEKHSGNGIVGRGSSKVEAVDLDSDLGARTVHFLKIDVEGHELRALRGARRILGQKPHMVLELHNFQFAARLATVRAILTHFPHKEWRCEFSAEVPDTPVEIQGPIDAGWLAQFDNPHLFFTPA